jgi:outer membrane protein assembly factor BamB
MFGELAEKRITKGRKGVALRLACACSVLLLSLQTHARDVLLMGEHAGYGVTRAHADSCFAITAVRVASNGATLYAIKPGAQRMPAVVKRTFDEGVSIVRIGSGRAVCESDVWSDGVLLEIALDRTGIGALLISGGDGTRGRLHVRVEKIGLAGYFFISPVREAEKLMSGMVGSRVLLEDMDAGILLDVDEESNRGRVIRQDYLTSLLRPFFESWVEEAEPEHTPQSKPERAMGSGPRIKYRFFIGKQSWRNNPKIVGTRIFVGSSGRTRGQSDALDGVYSFDLIGGERVWFVPTQNDFNDLTYAKGLVIGGTDSGQVVAIGARSGKTYWSRQFSAPVSARPVAAGTAVAIATASGKLMVLDVKDGSTMVKSNLGGGVSGGLAADRSGLWVATEAGTLHRYTGFGEVQMRRDSSVYYPDELGQTLSGSAIHWYDRLGNGKGLRASVSAPPLVLDDSVVLSLVREDAYEYPPVISFRKDGALGWIGTDPSGLVPTRFGNSRMTPVSWYNRVILADAESNSIYSISRETGEIVWATDLGNPNFELWSSPVVSNDHVYIGTYDGFLHKFDASNGQRVWSMYLGQNELAGRVFDVDEPLPEINELVSPPMLSSPIFATAAVADETIVVGTEEGYLYVIDDPEQ